MISEKIIESSKVRSKLCLNNFYTIDKLNRLAEIMINTPSLKSAISSYKIDEDSLSVQFQVRHSYCKFHNVLFDWYSDENINTALYNFFKEYKLDIISTIGQENIREFYRNLSLHYFFSIYGTNTFVIYFI